jgi:hypothetical protein
MQFGVNLEMTYTRKLVTACCSHVSVTTYMYIVYHTFKTSETTLLCSELPVVQKSELGNLTRVNVLTAADTAVFWSPSCLMQPGVFMQCPRGLYSPLPSSVTVSTSFSFYGNSVIFTPKKGGHFFPLLDIPAEALQNRFHIFDLLE